LLDAALDFLFRSSGKLAAEKIFRNFGSSTNI
jgi:hypothetical protein